MNSNLFKRIITGVLFVIVLAGGILLDSYSFLVIFSVVTVVGLWEFYSLIEKFKRAKINRSVHAFGGFLLLSAFFIHASATDYIGKVSFVPYLIYLLYVYISQLYKKDENPLQNWAYIMLGQVYVALPFALLSLLPFQLVENEIQYQPVIPFAFFVFIWISDSGAYVVGSTFGRKRLFERISPKKSWEGFLGGLLLAIAASFMFAYYFPGTLSSLEWLGMAIIIVVFGTWGDLSESLLKRTLGIKDSGNILPGHGGILDRFDSVLLASPACVAYFILLEVLT